MEEEQISSDHKNDKVYKGNWERRVFSAPFLYALPFVGKLCKIVIQSYGTSEKHDIIRIKYGCWGATIMMEGKNERREPSKILYVILVVIYLLLNVVIVMVARSKQVVTVNGNTIPMSAYTGVVSSITNFCLIFIVVFFRKMGFITSLVLLLMQYPMILVSIIIRHQTGSIPGLFTNTFTIVAIILIYNRTSAIDKYQEKEVEVLKREQMTAQNLFEDTATALVNAIDAKDQYSRGHSLRVAEYSKLIAEELDKDAEDCERVYYAALLHDVGKIGISDAIINKSGRLTPEEYGVIKQHPVMGNQILSSIREYPYISIGAHYHHERYDGKGYPDGLKGEEIPEIARIISVADAYDAMTSDRSYRTALPQAFVREEFVKGSGTQFDPNFAQVMIKLIDNDKDYLLREMTWDEDKE